MFFLTTFVILGLLAKQQTLAMYIDEITEKEIVVKKKEQKIPSGIQLSQGSNNTLEAILGTGNNVLLKMSMSLKALKTPLDKENQEIPVRLFLTDFTSSPTSHPAVDFKVKVDCEETTPFCILPDKPQAFDSYAQFTDWLHQGYFTNQLRITYDFYIDVHKSAPLLAQNLFAVSLGGYHFIGTHAIYNAVINPDQCVPQVTYASQRGATNATTATLGGTLYCNNEAAPITNDCQIFPHQIVDEIIFKRDETKKFYSHKWMAQSEVTSKVTFEEFPKNQIQNWPNAPSGTYSLLKQQPGDLEEIQHIACWDGNSGEEIDISDGKTFLIVCEEINKPDSQLLESIVKGDTGNMYTVHYQYSKTEKIKKEELAEVRMEEEQNKEIACIEASEKQDQTEDHSKVDDIVENKVLQEAQSLEI